MKWETEGRRIKRKEEITERYREVLCGMEVFLQMRRFYNKEAIFMV